MTCHGGTLLDGLFHGNPNIKWIRTGDTSILGTHISELWKDEADSYRFGSCLVNHLVGFNCGLAAWEHVAHEWCLLMIMLPVYSHVVF